LPREGVQVIVIVLAARFHAFSPYIVAPTVLIDNWKNEFENFLNNMERYGINDNKRKI